MLEQVGEARLAGLLVLRANVVPDVDSDHGRLGVLMDNHPQAVIQGELRVGNIDISAQGAGGHSQRAGH